MKKVGSFIGDWWRLVNPYFRSEEWPIAIVLLVAVSTGAVAYGLLYSRIETDKKTASRINRVRSAETDTLNMKAARDRVQEISKRRKSVQDSLKELEKKQQLEKTKKANASRNYENVQEIFSEGPGRCDTFYCSTNNAMGFLKHPDQGSIHDKIYKRC